jgi:hypothetical protein
MMRIECFECGFVTTISWRRRKTEPRYCRNCGIMIRAPLFYEPIKTLQEAKP